VRRSVRPSCCRNGLMICWEELLVEASPSISHRENDVIAARAQLDTTRQLARELHGVRQEIAHDLPQAYGVARDPRRRGVDLERSASCLARRTAPAPRGPQPRIPCKSTAGRSTRSLPCIPRRNVDEVAIMEPGPGGKAGQMPRRRARGVRRQPSSAGDPGPHHHRTSGVRSSCETTG